MPERELPSDCPACNKPMWRDGRRIMIQWKADGEVEGRFSVCRHCSGIFKLFEVRGRLTWAEPPKDELAAVLPELLPVAMKFAAIRQLEAQSPGWLDRAEARQTPRDRRRDH